MLIQLPRLSNSLRDHFDIDQAYLKRKQILQNLITQRPVNTLEDSKLARKIVYQWEEASSEVRQVYKQFVGAIVELIDGEVSSEEFREVAKTVYDLFRSRKNENKKIAEKKAELQKLVGYAVSETSVQKVASLAQKLSALQPRDQDKEMDVNSDDLCEFGADIVFNDPGRFLVDMNLENWIDVEEEREDSTTSTSIHEDPYQYSEPMVSQFGTDKGRGINLRWLREKCGEIAIMSGSQLSGDELAMTLCQVLDSDKPGDEIAGDLLDLIGDNSFEIIQDLLKYRKELVDAIHHGLHVLKTEKMASNSQPKMPSYGTQVTIQTESEKQIDKLRRKEEKRHRRGAEQGSEHEFSTGNFSSLLQASEQKNPFDELIGNGKGPLSLLVSSLPQGTLRKYFKGYEEVQIPPTPTAHMKPGERLVLFIYGIDI
ncbi:hypothetical protein GIB67_000656 [Kingdonia uniflora]|uniref:DExH14 plug domain-containing protein n=1 Tax=Kingdonia uniflora TaxID=39325 RepID=A0A7J7NDL4_9MAGN|nr:hypothetical protein GIB67_000656 [Kingdonia uniflora]